MNAHASRPTVFPAPIDLRALKDLHAAHVEWLAKGYADALRAAGYGALAIHSGTPKSRSAFDDQFWPLRVTPHFQHWLSLETAGSLLVLEPGRKPRLVWNDDVGFWEAPLEPETDHFWDAFEVVRLKQAAKRKDHLPAGRVAFVGEDAADAEALGFAAADVNPKALLAALDQLRVTKTPYERLCLREANRRAAIGHARVLEAFRDEDQSELSLHLLYLEATAQDDPETPYKNIVALGRHAATLHHVGYSRRAEGAQSLLLDAGASYQGYDSDITRTAVKGKGAAADVFAALIARLETLQQEMCRRVAVGVPYQRLHDESHELLAVVLKELGLARGSADELVARGVTRKFLPHGLGHSLGLQTHDVGCAQVKPEPRNPFLRNTTIVREGQVFTIEPGCYFIDSLLQELRASDEGKLVDWSVVDALAPFGGVRIEDDVALEPTGAVTNLTRDYLPE